MLDVHDGRVRGIRLRAVALGLEVPLCQGEVVDVDLLVARAPDLRLRQGRRILALILARGDRQVGICTITHQDRRRQSLPGERVERDEIRALRETLGDRHRRDGRGLEEGKAEVEQGSHGGR